MEILLDILAGFFPVVVVIGTITAIVVFVRRRRPSHEQIGIGSLRRLFFYGLSLAALLVATNGLSLILQSILGSFLGPKAITSDTTLALGMALTIVGTPIWFVFWRAAQNSVRRFPIESQSATRKAYIYLVLAVSSITTAVAAIILLQSAQGTGGLNETSLAMIFSWGAVWAYHWSLEDKEGQPSPLTVSIRRVYVYGLALFGMVILTLGLGTILQTALSIIYQKLSGSSNLLLAGEPLRIWTGGTQASLAMTVIGGGLWWWHWHRIARVDIHSTLRLIYVYCFGIFSGATTVVISSTILLFHVMQWIFGNPDVSSASLHFDILPGVIGAMTIGGGLWTYHWAVIRHEAPTTQYETIGAKRVYGYLMSSIGLVTLGFGLVIATSIVVGLLSTEPTQTIIPSEDWRNELALSITLLAIGTAVWGYYWRNMQHLATMGSTGERTALSRRLFILLIFGASIVLTLINMSIVLFKVFDLTLRGTFNSSLFWDIRWSISILLTAGAISLYYWLVLRTDREIVAEQAVTPTSVSDPSHQTQFQKEITILSSIENFSVVRQLEDRLGYHLQVWQPIEPFGTAQQVPEQKITEITQNIIDANSDQVLVIIKEDEIIVVPYQVH